MVNMVYAILAIALNSAAIYASIAYTDVYTPIRRELESRLGRGFDDLQRGYERFVYANPNVRPDTMQAITPGYAFIPPAPWQGSVWDYGVGGSASAAYFCFYGPFNTTRLDAAKHLFTKFSPQAFFINSACGAVSNNYPASITGEVNLSITLWVSY